MILFNTISLEIDCIWAKGKKEMSDGSEVENALLLDPLWDKQVNVSVL